MRYQPITPDEQLTLFDTLPMAGPRVPGGFFYEDDFLTREEEQRLMAIFQTLPFRNDVTKGYEARRRKVGYGWHGGTIPEFLLPFRDRAAKAAGIPPESLFSALLSEYTPGTPIGFHRDKPTIGHVLGVSLGSTCQFRLRRKTPLGWDMFAVAARPRSLYCMRGESRRDWQHGIPPVDALRYSITFRDFNDV